MKDKLGETLHFVAIVDKTSVKKGCHVKMTMLKDIMVDGTLISDHEWVERSERFTNIHKGYKIEFTGKVAQYLSLDEEFNQVIKYKISKLRNIRRMR